VSSELTRGTRLHRLKRCLHLMQETPLLQLEHVHVVSDTLAGSRNNCSCSCRGCLRGRRSDYLRSALA
jgi:hypothetical protein